MRPSIRQARYYGVVSIAGRLADYGEDGGLAAVMAAAAEHPDLPWALDLSGIDEIGPAAAAMLVALGGAATAQNLRLAAIIPAGPAADAAALADLAHSLAVFPSLEAFLAECAPAALLAARHPCAPEEHPLALAARQLTLPAGMV